MRTRPKLDLWLTLLSLAFPCVVHALPSDLADPEARTDGTIEIEYPVNNLTAYRDRRPPMSIVAGLKYENLTPTAYKSKIDGHSYTSIFGHNSVPLTGLDIGAKGNFHFGSIGGSLSYQTGSMSDKAQGVSIGMDITKMAAHATLSLDTLMPEPYVVPYGQIDFMNLSYTEKDNVGNQSSGDANALMGFTAGVLFQLNWMDPDSSYQSLDQVGVNNTFLDVFISKVNDGGGGSGPSFANDLDWGLGLRVEF